MLKSILNTVFNAYFAESFNWLPAVIFVACSIAGVIICVVFCCLYARYLNRRLKNDGEKQKFPQPLIFILSVILAVSLITNIAFLNSDISNNRNYNELLSKTFPRSTVVSDFDMHSEFAGFRDALIGGSLPGYEITKEAQGNFECIIALAIGEISSMPFMPRYFVLIRYTGTVPDGIKMNRFYSYNEQGNGYGSTGMFKPDTLLIGNALGEDIYIGIKTILKIAPANVSNDSWNALPVYAESHFIVEIAAQNN